MRIVCLGSHEHGRARTWFGRTTTQCIFDVIHRLAGDGEDDMADEPLGRRHVRLQRRPPQHHKRRQQQLRIHFYQQCFCFAGLELERIRDGFNFCSGV